MFYRVDVDSEENHMWPRAQSDWILSKGIWGNFWEVYYQGRDETPSFLPSILEQVEGWKCHRPHGWGQWSRIGLTLRQGRRLPPQCVFYLSCSFTSGAITGNAWHQLVIKRRLQLVIQAQILCSTDITWRKPVMFVKGNVVVAVGGWGRQDKH